MRPRAVGCWLALVLLAVTGCSSVVPSWLSLPPLGKTTEQSQSQQPAAHTGSQPPPAAAAAQLDAQAMKLQPLGEAIPLDKKGMSEYVSELATGVQLEQARKYDEARQHFEKLIEKWPGEYQAYHHLGQVCDRQKHYGEAQENYQHAILLAQNRDPAIFNDLGYSYFLQGNLTKAESAIRKAVALRPSEQKFHNNLGLVYGHQRRFEEAWNEFRRAEGEADAYYNLAFVKSSLNDFKGAKACFRQALAVDPSHERARRALRAFEVADTDPDSLAQMEYNNDSGTDWVPYVEGGGQDTSAQQAATAGNDKPSVAGSSPAMSTAQRISKTNRSN